MQESVFLPHNSCLLIINTVFCNENFVLWICQPRKEINQTSFWYRKNKVGRIVCGVKILHGNMFMASLLVCISSLRAFILVLFIFIGGCREPPLPSHTILNVLLCIKISSSWPLFFSETSLYSGIIFFVRYSLVNGASLSHSIYYRNPILIGGDEKWRNWW